MTKKELIKEIKAIDEAADVSGNVKKLEAKLAEVKAAAAAELTAEAPEEAEEAEAPEAPEEAKESGGSTNLTPAITLYVVALGKAFSCIRGIVGENEAITEKDFPDAKVFNRFLKAGYIKKK